MTFCTTKDPDAVLDYSIDWSRWLGTDTIQSSTWTADVGITIDSDTNSTKAATAVISGGIELESYGVTNHIVTAAGLRDDRTITFTIYER